MDFLDWIITGFVSIFGVVGALFGLKKKKSWRGGTPQISKPRFTTTIEQESKKIEQEFAKKKREPFDLDASKERLEESRRRRDEWDADD